MRHRAHVHWTCLLAGLFVWTAFPASDWPGWRGPGQNGFSDSMGLVSRWTVDGENQLWRADITVRSTPVVFDGRVCAIGRQEDGGRHITKREVVACFDAGTGRQLWRVDMPVYLTTVPFTRAGWANVAADPETGNLYAHGVGGYLAAFDRGGKILWQREMTEEFGRFSGYGGRTHTPVVDGDLVLLTFGTAGTWGGWLPGRHRYFAFDKRTGELVWHSLPGTESPADLNTYGVPVVAEIGGQRLLIHGAGDGYVNALQVNTGKLVWRFGLTKRGINTAVVVSGDRVYAVHGEENRDEPTMGRAVCIDGTGQGDVTETHEIWRNNEAGSGFVSPLLVKDRLYLVDNAANMRALDAASGKLLWELSLGTVGKGSPVYGDGKIYAPEVNGRLLIVEPGQDEGRILDSDLVSMPEGRYAEVYGSPAIAYGRIYFPTENGIYCLGDPAKPFQAADSRHEKPRFDAADREAPVASLQVVPAETVAVPGQRVQYRVRAFDEQGYYLRDLAGEWSLNGLKGRIDSQGGSFQADPETPFQAGVLKVSAAGQGAEARLRVISDLPLEVDFSGLPDGQSPPYFVGAAGRFQVVQEDGNAILKQPPWPRSHDRGYLYLGPPSQTGYTIQADMRGTRVRRKEPDFGLVNSRYILQLAGPRLQIFSWISEKRVDVSEPFEWREGVWYTMKLRVDLEGGQAIVRGKVWARSEAEPADWMVTATDPLAISNGSPGLYGVSRTDIYFDNVKVTRNP